MKVIVVIPTYNERDNLEPLVQQVLERGYSVLVVDDNSPDGTGARADTLSAAHPGRVEVLHRTGRRGLGRSYLDGLQRAVAAGADRICQMDADFSHEPKYLPDLVAATERFDVVIGSRYLNGISVVNWPLHRIVLSAFGNRYIRFVTRLTPRDCTSGFRCWRRDALSKLRFDEIKSEGYAFLVELLYEASQQGCTIGEVPIIFVERRQGVSKLSGAVLRESLIAPWRMRLLVKRP
jgi:dolichol-phosphate mannosyltransferase